jgi:ribosome modulation factor
MMNADQAFQDGFDAFHAGKDSADCPINLRDSELYDAWMLGWLDARGDDERTEAEIAAHIASQEH